MDSSLLTDLIRVSPFVALLAYACWLLWRKIEDKDKELNANREEVLEAYKESIKVTNGVITLVDQLKGDLQRDFRDIHTRLDRIESTHAREKRSEKTS